MENIMSTYVYSYLVNGGETTTGNWGDAHAALMTGKTRTILVSNGKDIFSIETTDELDQWSDKLARDHAWNPEAVFIPPQKVPAPMVAYPGGFTAVAPAHYDHYLDDYEWVDVMSRIQSLRDPVRFIAAVEMQIRKYLDRLGKKDVTVQELKKSRFYLQYLIQYMENDCKPILAKDVHEFLGTK